MNASLYDALIAGAVAVTPNRRLARHLLRQFDLAQIAAGRRAWQTPSILPLQAWLQTLWEAVHAASSHPLPVLLTPAQSALQWQSVVNADPRVLFDKRGAAELAANAWTLVHGWGSGGESWRAWRDAGDTRNDPATFAEWAESYHASLQRARAIDLAQLPDVLARSAEALHATAGDIVLAGFVELTPQQERLMEALRRAGSSIKRCESVAERPVTAQRVLTGSPRDELVVALTWARKRALANPRVRIGVVIEDLAQRRESVVALAHEILAPSIGVAAPGKGPPFEVSLGLPLTMLPLTASALSLVALAHSRLPLGEAAVLLRSPYLPDADTQWAQRAAVERLWLREGRVDLGLNDVIDTIDKKAADLAARWRVGRDVLATPHGSSPREWVDTWREWLAAAGWPGTRALSSEEFQARDAWERLLAQFATLGTVAPRLGAARALDVLRGLAAVTLFQPEGSAAPVHILGTLEASGLDFDALWVAGMSAERWPPPPAPNPLLPLAWQRERGVPRASAQRELAYAETLTAWFARSAPEVVFSSAAMIDDHPAAASALIMGFPERALMEPPRSWWAAAGSRGVLQVVRDTHAPPLQAGAVAPGGAGIVAAQSDCPFRAVAAFRLNADAWQTPLIGLSPRERGSLVHACLAFFWSDVRDSATLHALSDARCAELVGAAVDRALGALPSTRRDMLPVTVLSAEHRRLRALLDAWLSIERGRAPFTAESLEHLSVLRLADIDLRIRLDRVDRLEDGGFAIIDYKTGKPDTPRQWFDERPRSVQLGLYTLSQRAAEPGTVVRAAVFGQLRHDAVAAVGLAADGSAWPGLTPVHTVDMASWDRLEEWWREHLGRLGMEIAAGLATVTPRRAPSPCRNCGLQALCRIESVGVPDDEADSDDEPELDPELESDASER